MKGYIVYIHNTNVTLQCKIFLNIIKFANPSVTKIKKKSLRKQNINIHCFKVPPAKKTRNGKCYSYGKIFINNLLQHCTSYERILFLFIIILTFCIIFYKNDILKRTWMQIFSKSQNFFKTSFINEIWIFL